MDNGGGWGVSVFLVLSGFLMYSTYCEKKIELSIKNCISVARSKVGRLYPLHLLMLIPAVAIDAALIVVGRSQEKPYSIVTRLIPNIMLIHTWIPKRDIYFGFNGVAWYLSTYLFICIAFLPILSFMRRGEGWTIKKAITCLLLCLCIPIATSYIIELRGGAYLEREWLLYVFPPMRLLDFIAGMQVGFIYKKYGTAFFTEKQSSFLTAFVIALCFIGTFYISSCSGNILWKVFAETSIVFMPTSCVLVYLVACERGCIIRQLNSQCLMYVGGISMYTFLIHHQVIQYVHMAYANFISRDVNVYVMSAIAFVVTVTATEMYIAIKDKFDRKPHR